MILFWHICHICVCLTNLSHFRWENNGYWPRQCWFWNICLKYPKQVKSGFEVEELIYSQKWINHNIFQKEGFWRSQITNLWRRKSGRWGHHWRCWGDSWGLGPVTKVSSDYLILMIWSSSFSDDNKHICKMFAIVMLWGSRFGQMRMFSYFMMTIFDNTFWWQFSDFWKIFWFFEILWHFTLEALITCDTWDTDYTDFLKSCDTWDTAYMWHLRHWLHCWQLRTTLLRINLWPLY